MRTGIGYDIHRLAAGRRLVIGGVEIPFDKGLAGHSDGDALLHAIMDALLGAAGLPDIGIQFPTNDPRYEGADSLLLLKKVSAMVSKCGYSIINVDSTVVAEQPQIAAHISEMKARIAAALGISASGVGIKATTNEGLGAIGRGEGIASFATAMLRKTSGE